MSRFAGLLCFIAINLTTGCASNGSHSDSGQSGAEAAVTTSSFDIQKQDPLEKVNKGIYSFNIAFDDSILKPTARGYEHITPGPVSRGITNFFQNLSEPRVMVNSFLQGKVDRGMTSLARFAINTTVGLGGLIDWAGKSGAPFVDEDFGQTLAVWGWTDGAYVMLPVLGPSNVRDTLGTVVDFFSYPLLYYHDATARNGLYVFRIIDNRANALGATDILTEAAGDKEYEFLREAYKQRRQSQVNNGNAPLEGLEFIEEN